MTQKENSKDFSPGRRRTGNLFFTIVLILLSYNSHLLWAQSENNLIVTGTIDSFHSKILDEERKLWIYVPDIASKKHQSEQKFPVIYLLDGPSNFYSVVGLVDRLSATMIIPPMIIVGIANNNRFRDLTPTKPEEENQMPLPPFVGGGEAFISCIEEELIPYIDANYPTAPYRMLIGHSLGGLMVIHTLLNHSHLFNQYLSLDPSLWWDNNIMEKKADSIFQKETFEGKALYLAMAHNGIPEGMAFESVLLDTTENTQNARPILQFSNVLKARNPKGLRAMFQYYPEDNHGSVTMIATYDALRFFFKKYTIPASLHYQIPDPAFQADSAITAHFKTASVHMGYEILPPEDFVNENAYAMMYGEDMERAYKLFDLNVRNYPKSFSAHNSMGEYYVTMDDKENAIRCFSKALEIKEIAATRKKLDELKAK
jgi:predicted alpha/beta superfamily hydrolase